MLNFRIALLLIALTILAGCRTSPNHHNKADSSRGNGQQNLHKGGLQELDVIGVDLESEASEDEIASVAASTLHIVIPNGSSVMLIKSGAVIPDEDMVKGLEKNYIVSTFNGSPPAVGNSGAGYSRSLRLAAAKSGADKLIVYWEIQEIGKEKLPDKSTIWSLFSGGDAPNEKQPVRMRMKIAVVDVKSGQWEIFSPETLEAPKIINVYSNKLLELKVDAHKAAAENIIKRYSK